MARLNEAPAPTESVEALKRRFLRQNRELAKTNSNQSLRISALEIETSRLVAENAALRQEIIHLQSQLEESQGIHLASFMGIKDNLEAKVRELNSLVEDLGKLQRGGNGKTSLGHPGASSEEHCRAQKPAKLDVAADQEGKLPTIDENKSYPRESLRPEDVLELRLSDQTNESPDIGPPPVAHFECDDPIKFEPRTVRQEQSDFTDTQDVSVALPANLETRRRRRESNTRFDSKKFHVFESSPLEKVTHSSTSVIALDSQSAQTTLKAGAKRKLNVRDAPVSTDEALTKPAEEFHYSRKVGPDSETGTTNPTAGQNAVPTAENRTTTLESGKRDRKILADKSANLSPFKSTTAIVDRTKSKNGMKTAQQNKEGTEETAGAKPSVTAPSQGNITLMDTTKQAPKTPALAELLSPTSTVTSTAGTDSRDTPPPSDLGGSTTLRNGSAATARTARRARAQVSYAEPNLVSKMRRPNKNLVDAVISEGKRQENANAETGSSLSNSDSEKSKMRTVIVQRENSGVDWNQPPAAADMNGNSPLGQKGSASSRRPVEPPDISRSENKASHITNTGSKDLEASAIAAASKRKRDRAAIDERVGDTVEKLESLTVYDFNETSPESVAGDAELHAVTDTTSKLPRQHFPIRDLPNRKEANKHVSSKTGSADSLKHSKRSSQQGSTRTTADQNSIDQVDGSEQSRKESPGNIGNVGAGRSERAARRRSMML